MLESKGTGTWGSPPPQENFTKMVKGGLPPIIAPQLLHTSAGFICISSQLRLAPSLTTIDSKLGKVSVLCSPIKPL